MSRFFLAVGVLGFSAAESHAAGKFFASNATCERVKGLIARDGEVVLRFPSSRVAGMTLYDRYVQNDRRCESNDMTSRSSLPLPIILAASYLFARRTRIVSRDTAFSTERQRGLSAHAIYSV